LVPRTYEIQRIKTQNNFIKHKKHEILFSIKTLFGCTKYIKSAKESLLP
jgi:hypothetical protein